MPTWLKPHLMRILVITVVSFGFALLFNEITYNLQAGEHDRAPRTITFVIPAGTAARIAAGEMVNIFPEDQVFVVGDVIKVQNNDSEPHQLGPVWAPPGSTGSLTLEKAANLRVDCSFESARVMGLDIRPATTWVTRLTGLMLTGPTLAVLLWLYSLAAMPVKGPNPPAPFPKGKGG